MEILANAFVVFVVLHVARSRSVPEYVRGLTISSAYFVSTSCTQLFSQGGNNLAKSLPLVFLSGNYFMILWYSISSAIGFVLGFILLYLVKSNSKRESKLKFMDNQIMENAEDGINDRRNESDEIREDK